MSHLQGVVFIALLCAVNAAVTVNVYEDDITNITEKLTSAPINYGSNQESRVLEIANEVEPSVDTVVANELRDCDQLACMMGCQELGAPGGSCSLGECRCYKRGSEEEMKTSSRSCISVICTQQCLQSKHLGGRCRNGRCVCF